MEILSASAAGFLSTPWGMALFILLDIAIFTVIAALNYRWLFKRFFDMLFSAVFMIAFLPFFLLFLAADAVYNKIQNAYKSLFVSEYFVGKKEKIIRVTVFATERVEHDEQGNLLPRAQRVTKFGRFLELCGMKYYPCLPAIFSGKLSFVGPRALSLEDAAATDEVQAQRFAVRPGLVSSLERYGGETLTYTELFEEDVEYVKRYGLFRDFGYFMLKIVHRLRGENASRYGECEENSYVDRLLQTGAIDEQTAHDLHEEGKRRLKNYRKAKESLGDTVNHDMMR